MSIVFHSLAQAHARQLLMLEPHLVQAQLDQLKPEQAHAVRDELNKFRTSLCVPALSNGQTVTCLELWKRHWRDIKLMALDFKFYQHQQWTVEEGDLYCITRHGQALFRVKAFTPTSILMDQLWWDTGEMPPENKDRPPYEWNAEEFLQGGFIQNRVPIKRWMWTEVARENGLILSDENTFVLDRSAAPA